VSEIALSDSARIEVALWGKNLTDEDVKTWGIDFGDFTNAQFMDPMTYGLDVTLSF
jgi:hypothetical protein